MELTELKMQYLNDIFAECSKQQILRATKENSIELECMLSKWRQRKEKKIKTLNDL